MKQKSLSVFIPVYNEEEILDNTISAILSTVKSITDDYEILIIDDGSTDSSKEKALRWVDQSDRIKLIEHQANLGYGSALISGFKNSKKDLILYTDADLPEDFNEIRTVLPLMENYDLVIGYRLNRKYTPRRFIYSKIYNFLLKVLLNVKAKDGNCSFKCIRKEAIEKINLTAKTTFIDGELLAEAVHNNLAIKEIPLVYKPRENSKSNFDSIKAAIFAMNEILSYWINNILFK